MKTQILLIVLLSLVGYANAQIQTNSVGLNQHNNIQSKYNNKNSLSVKGGVWQWDTIISFDTSGLFVFRRTQTFNSQGKVLTYLIEAFSNDNWNKLDRYTFNYDANGNKLISLRERFLSNIWTNSYRETSTYDSNGNELTYLSEIFSNDKRV